VLSVTRTQFWSDTVVRQICRAGIQLQTRRVTTYQPDSTTLIETQTTVAVYRFATRYLRAIITGRFFSII